MPEQHARLSASGSARWLACPGSIIAEEEYPDTSSEAAEEGTRAHEFAAEALTKGMDSIHCEDEDMVDGVQAYHAYVQNILKSEPGSWVVGIERQVSMEKWIPGGFGTADCIIANPLGEIHIVDFKYGRGVKVDAEYNSQLQLYALGAIEICKIKIERATLHIVQPRMNNYSSWTIERDALDKFGGYAMRRARLALGDNPKRIPGTSQCRWCKAAGTCRELCEEAEKEARAAFDDTVELDKLTIEERGEILARRDLVLGFYKSVEASLRADLEFGVPCSTWKLVERMPNRKWTQEAGPELQKRLGEEAWEKKPIGITKATRLVGKEVVAELTDRPEAKTILVPVDDPRPAKEI